MAFLPVSRQELIQKGVAAPDFVFVTGDAYVDHPSFGVSILSRLLEYHGYTVAILPQPDINQTKDFTRFGRPKLGFLVTSGNIDSMVSHYTVAKKRRSYDVYSAGGKTGKRPDRAVLAYTRRLKRIYPDCPVIIGGLEASLRRFAHYDYWDDCVRPSILIDSGADLLTYGMGENQTLAIAQHLKEGLPIAALHNLRGVCYAVPTKEYVPASVCECPSFERVRQDKRDYAVACRKQMEEQDAVRGRVVIQRHGSKILVQNPPMPPLTTQELDLVYALPYMRTYHPMYEKEGGVPGIAEVEFSITHNRGCFGACNFCALAFHQGRAVTARSEQSVLDEAVRLTKYPHFKGYIHDVGGPTANFRLPSCKIQEKAGLCKNKKCLAPHPCRQLQASHAEYLNLLRKLRSIPGVKKVFIRSGIRFDYMMADPDRQFFRELVQYHISGQLKVAPEHCSNAVLDKMGKPHIQTYKRFANEFYKLTGQLGKEQYLVPYFMSSHPGSTMKDAVELALFLKQEHIHPEQVQDFYPTPGTVSTCMFYTGMDPYTLQQVYVPKTAHEKAMQRALLQYFQPKNRELVIEALLLAGREDLIGTDKKCLVPPTPAYRARLLQKQRTAHGSRKNLQGRKKKRRG
ncbi:MAG TPA: YgiQ family radical SAM protein [Candidatus Scatavimonas merdigallinarum]|uniref:YgiQ family radical SAM protein n=1 Tax=Candidatus Scatavimonas merdigallinarum TaxID=2840914 RepID=A0A9D0ZIK0_9FIRM|nr:YgiQ family radical SAM protein [Candidatus Scatavimonas merdigallinarum]